VDDRRAAADLDIGAHAAQLGDVHVAVLEDRFLEEALPGGEASMAMNWACMSVGKPG
jgi:hypothetical protein